MKYFRYTLDDLEKSSDRKLFDYISFFAGGGGSSAGYKLAGGDCKFVNEFQQVAVDTYLANWPETPHHICGDIKAVSGQQIMEMTGIKNVADYLTSPDQLPPEQPDPAQELQLELMKKQIEVQDRQTAIGEMKAQMDSEVAKMKMELDRLKAENTFAIASDNVDLKEAQLNHKKFVDSAELVLAENADEITAIASPNG